MTVVVAAVVEQRVVMAADRQASAGWQKMEHGEPKLWANDPFIFGGAGRVRTLQVIKHHASWPTYRSTEDSDLETFLVKRMLSSLRTALKDNGRLKNDLGIESWDSSLLLAFGDKLASFDHDGAVTFEYGRMAIGSGGSEALGRLGNVGPWTEADVIDAARRATLTAHGCGGPLSYVDTRDLIVRTV